MADRPSPPGDYDRIWDEVYGDLQDCGPTHRHMIRLIRRVLAPLEYSSVLDVGVGFGHNLPALTENRNLQRIAGIDVSQRAVDRVSADWPGEFRRLDITTGRLPETFDLVCCALVLEHLEDDREALANMRAMTRRHLLVVTIGGSYERYEPWERQMGHVRNYRRGELEEKLASAGFHTCSLIRWGFPFYSPVARLLQNRMRASAEFPRSAQAVARILYRVYFLNSSRRGDLLVALARPG